MSCRDINKDHYQNPRPKSRTWPLLSSTVKILQNTVEKECKMAVICATVNKSLLNMRATHTFTQDLQTTNAQQ